MKTLGMIGGVGPESTIDYYKRIINLYQHLIKDGNYPQIIINSINLKTMIDLITSQKYDEVVENLVLEINKLALAGADFALISSNTPHIVFDRIKEKSHLPLISIVESACTWAKKMNVTKAGLLGTKFTMRSGFYQKEFNQNGIEIVIPESNDIELIHFKYMEELVKGVFSNETKKYFLNIVDFLINEHNIGCLILGGTELPLLLKDEFYRGVLMLDTTKIHVEYAVKELIK